MKDFARFVVAACLISASFAETKFSSFLEPAKTYVCRDPTPYESTLDPNFSQGLIKYNGGCMPDATCVNGTSAWTNLFGYLDYLGNSYDGRCAFFNGRAALPEEVGWFIVVGLGSTFAIAVTLVQWISTNKLGRNSMVHSSEHFGSAGRSISKGWIACHIVSQWTWAATLLQSSNVAFEFGVSGPFWYAAGATIQVLLFAVLAVEIKRKCPAVHTLCEICLARWGTAAHVTFVFFVLMTMCGLTATYTSAWSHVAIIYMAMLIFLWKVYVGPSDLGSTGTVWHNLLLQAEKNPVSGNAGGSYLTMWSTPGLVFGMINIVGNFGTVFCDQSYWQGAIAARPSVTYKGYLLGGIAWFAIPFTMATTLGLSARALDLPLTIEEAKMGLVPPAVAMHLFGTGGSLLILVQLFMAVTASAASEQIGVASVLSYDVYKRYINPRATGSQILLVSRIGILAWACVSGLLAIVLQQMGVSLGWVYLAMGNIIGSAVAPVAMALTVRRCTAAGAVASAWVGAACAIAGWCLAAARIDGTVRVETLGDSFSMLAGNLIALLASPAVALAVSWARPEKFDWSELREKTQEFLIDDDISVSDRMRLRRQLSMTGTEGGGGGRFDEGVDDANDGEIHAGGVEGGMIHGAVVLTTHTGGSTPGDTLDSADTMHKVLLYSYWTGAGLSAVLIVLWPVLSLVEVQFSPVYWGWWVSIAFVWAHCSAALVILLPLWESRDILLAVVFRRHPPVEEDTLVVMSGAGTSDVDVSKRSSSGWTSQKWAGGASREPSSHLPSLELWGVDGRTSKDSDGSGMTADTPVGLRGSSDNPPSSPSRARDLEALATQALQQRSAARRASPVFVRDIVGKRRFSLTESSPPQDNPDREASEDCGRVDSGGGVSVDSLALPPQSSTPGPAAQQPLPPVARGSFDLESTGARLRRTSSLIAPSTQRRGMLHHRGSLRQEPQENAPEIPQSPTPPCSHRDAENASRPASTALTEVADIRVVTDGDASSASETAAALYRPRVAYADGSCPQPSSTRATQGWNTLAVPEMAADDVRVEPYDTRKIAVTFSPTGAYGREVPFLTSSPLTAGLLPPSAPAADHSNGSAAWTSGPFMPSGAGHPSSRPFSIVAAGSGTPLRVSQSFLTRSKSRCGILKSKTLGTPDNGSAGERIPDRHFNDHALSGGRRTTLPDLHLWEAGGPQPSGVAAGGGGIMRRHSGFLSLEVKAPAGQRRLDILDEEDDFRLDVVTRKMTSSCLEVTLTAATVG